MACRLFSNKPLSQPSHCWLIINWLLRNKFQWNFKQNAMIFSQERLFENVVCKITAILLRPRYVQDVLYELNEAVGWMSSLSKGTRYKSCFQVNSYTRGQVKHTLLSKPPGKSNTSSYSSPPRQNSRHDSDDIFKCIFFNDDVCILSEISQNIVPMGPIDK